MGATTNGTTKYPDFGEWKKKTYMNSNKQREQIFVSKVVPYAVKGATSVDKCFGEKVGLTSEMNTNKSEFDTRAGSTTAITNNYLDQTGGFSQIDHGRNKPTSIDMV